MPSNLPVHWGFSGGRAGEETEALDWIELWINIILQMINSEGTNNDLTQFFSFVTVSLIH